MLLSENKLKEMGQNGRNKMIDEYDNRIIIKRYMDLIQNYFFIFKKR